MRVNKFFSMSMALLCIVITITLCLPSTVIAVSSLNRLKSDRSDLINCQKVDRFNINLVLEKKIGDKELIEKAKDKLATLSDSKIRLISSLSDRICLSDHSASADIAFLLITTLIIFS